MDDKKNSEMNDKKNYKLIEEKIGLKDLLAIMIAQFQILLPILIGAVVVFIIILLFLTKVWFKN